MTLRSAAGLLFLALATTSSRAQDNLAVGDWVTHLSYREMNGATAGPTFAAYLGASSIVLRYHATGELRELTKVNALTQSDPVRIEANPFREGELFVAYADGAIEVLREEVGVIYDPAIAASNLIGDVDVLRIEYVSEGRVLLATTFGYLVYDIDAGGAGVFQEDVRIASGVRDADVLDGDLYLLTPTSLLRLPDYERQNTLRDISRYDTLATSDTLYRGGAIFLDDAPQGLAAYRGALYTGVDSSVVRIDPTAATADIVAQVEGARTVDMAATDGALVVGVTTPLGFDRGLYTTDGTAFTEVGADCFAGISGIGLSPGGQIAISGAAGQSMGYLPAPDADCRAIEIDGPYDNDAFAFAFADDGRVAVAAGGYTAQQGYRFSRDGVYLFADGDWSFYNRQNRLSFRLDPATTQFGDPADFSAVLFDGPDRLYAGAYFENLLLVDLANADATTDTVFDERNSSLRTNTGDRDRVRIAGLDLDPAGNLWVSNYGAPAPLSVRTASGDWLAIDPDCANQDLRNLRVDPETGIVWAIDSQRGLLAYDPAGTPLDLSDDVCRRFTTRDNLPANDVRSFAIDRDGAVWVGTTDGVGVISCARAPFGEGACGVDRPVAEVDGINGQLFEGEVINAIAVDGGNRKWLGTPSGLFLVEANGTEVIEANTESTSRLIDNRVGALGFDDRTGNLWIGTEAGIAVLRTATTGGIEGRFAPEVEVYPQPVRPDYDGPISIRGLARDATVKITDANGRLVFETDALGGQAVWDGRDYTGQRPASGVYTVWASAGRGFEGGPETAVAKIAVVR